RMTRMLGELWGVDATSVLLSPAPLYHSAPLRTTMPAHRLGATVVLLPRFDPEATLEAIARWHVTHGQFVPTMFVRLLRLPESRRRSVPVDSLRFAVHSGAPCAEG